MQVTIKEDTKALFGLEEGEKLIPKNTKLEAIDMGDSFIIYFNGHSCLVKREKIKKEVK